jgi:hypothetical protein
MSDRKNALNPNALDDLYEALDELVGLGGYFPTILPSGGVLPNDSIRKARRALLKAENRR